MLLCQIVSIRGRKGTPSNLAFGSSFRDPCRAPLGSESLIHRGQGCLALGIITMPCLEPWLQMPTQLVSPGQFACPRPSLPLASTRPRRPCRSSHCRTPRREVAGLVGARLGLRCPKFRRRGQCRVHPMSFFWWFENVTFWANSKWVSFKWVGQTGWHPQMPC